MQSDFEKLITKIQTDDNFYMQNFLKIKTKSGDLIPFKPNPMQIKSWKLIYDQQVAKGKPIRVIWLKARQHGISTWCEGKLFTRAVNRPNRNALIIAHEDKASQNLFNMSKLFYEEIPEVLRPMKKYSNESALSFENPTNDETEKAKNPGLRSKITVATAKNVNTGRSSTVHYLHASEVAFWDNPEVIMTGIMQCVPDTPDSAIFIESTANGIGGYYYDLWQKAVRGENDFLPIFLGWFENPEYTRPFETEEEKARFIKDCSMLTYDTDGKPIKSEELRLHEEMGISWEQLNWRKWTINNKLNGDVELFKQEYPATPEEAFIASGRPQFPITVLREYQKQTTPPIYQGYLDEDEQSRVKFRQDHKGYIRIWKLPEPSMFYTIGADVAEGLITGDYSCAIVLDERFDVIATWHGHIDPDLFGEELVKLAKFYNEGYLIPESNNHGLTAIRAVTRKEYWNIYYQKSYDKLGDQISQKIGWNTNRRTKPLMINTLTQYIREKWLGIKWDTIVSECFTYVIAEDGTTNAQAGSHDDTIMALALALQAMLEGRGEDYVPEIPSDQQREKYVGLDEEYFSDSYVAKDDVEEFAT